VNTKEIDEGIKELTEKEIAGQTLQEVAEGDQLGAQLDTAIIDWLERANAGEATPKLYLYKFDNPNDGKGKKLISRWENSEVPDEHGIGLMFGSGKYLMIATLPGLKKNNVKAWTFAIHPYYDELRRNQQIAGNPPTVQGFPTIPTPLKVFTEPQPAQPNPTEMGLRMVREVIQMLSPLLAQPKSGNTVDNAGALMMQNYQMMQEVLKGNLVSNTKLYADMAKMARDGVPPADDTDEDEDEPEAQSIIEKIMPMLQEWLPVLLGEGPKARAAVATVKALPQFQELKGNPGELSRVVAYLDKTEGKEKADKLLKRLKVNRPTGGKG
jgi:hypothetical protein